MLYSNCKTPSTYECLMLIASKFTIISLVEHAVYLTIITHFIQMSSCNFDPINDCNLWFQRTISSYSFDTSSYWAKYQISVNLWLFMTLLFLVALVRYFNFVYVNYQQKFFFCASQFVFWHLTYVRNGARACFRGFWPDLYVES